ncbi:MAG: hypothetical protein DI498_02385 [Paracoccus denitrificans]|nr:MAG: hypothetical protein DI498_02385 [Paracoccus denitrificans]PZO85995.1 MAG: hypothetical protein DI633_02385 [Paracoccus denitrificans]
MTASNSQTPTTDAPLEAPDYKHGQLTFWQLDASNDIEVGNLRRDIDRARSRLDSALFKHLAMLAPVAIGGMGVFFSEADPSKMSTAVIAMIAVPAAVLVATVMLSALSLAIAPTNVIVTADKDNRPITKTRAVWIETMRAAAERTNWHRGFEDNVEFYGFALAAFLFLAGGVWALLSL